MDNKVKYEVFIRRVPRLYVKLNGEQFDAYEVSDIINKLIVNKYTNEYDTNIRDENIGKSGTKICQTLIKMGLVQLNHRYTNTYYSIKDNMENKLECLDNDLQKEFIKYEKELNVK